jgi:tryptophan 2,3-dioxygenase
MRSLSPSDHLKLLSRLSTQQFLELRDKLFPASGFQSFQFAEIEIIMGFEEALLAARRTPRSLSHIQTASEQPDYGRSVWNRIESARCEVTLRKAIADWFYAFPVNASTPAMIGDASVINDFISNYMRRIHAYHENQIERLSVAPNADLSSIRGSFGAVAHLGREFLFALDVPEGERTYRQRVRAALLFVESYPDRAEVAVSRELVTSALEVEQSMLRWRVNHARVVERIIGRRVGTGGCLVWIISKRP